MSHVVKVQNISKKYLIQHNVQEGYSTLKDAISNQIKKIIKRLRHPFKMVQQSKHTTEEFWALQDISFTINEGDRVGIIGRNGAGKSTLLKILSRISEPSSGSIKIRGRIACLLEVGTGFHPELTGRENIFLNGAILGMKYREIKDKFDEIVAFSGVEQFLDTPMKRFSSGMHARLGFGIAAHLDSDLLIVDEVLAVGDAQFQAKCLKKMNELGASGRTILFVSHDVGSVLTLCNKGLYLEKGHLKAQGLIDHCVNSYMSDCRLKSLHWEGDEGDEHIRFTHASLSQEQDTREYFYQHESATLTIDYEVLKNAPQLIIVVSVWNQRNQGLAYTHTGLDIQNFSRYTQTGKHRLSFQINGNLFHEGEYAVKIECLLHGIKHIITDQISLKYNVFASQKNTTFGHLSNQQGISLGNQWLLNTRSR